MELNKMEDNKIRTTEHETRHYRGQFGQCCRDAATIELDAMTGNTSAREHGTASTHGTSARRTI